MDGFLISEFALLPHPSDAITAHNLGGVRERAQAREGSVRREHDRREDQQPFRHEFQRNREGLRAMGRHIICKDHFMYCSDHINRWRHYIVRTERPLYVFCIALLKLFSHYTYIQHQAQTGSSPRANMI